MSELWRKELERLQGRFDALIDDNARVGGLLVEISPEWYEFRAPPGLKWGKTPRGEEYFFDRAPCDVRTGHCEIVRTTVQQFEPPWPDPPRTLFDVSGNPIVASSGEPIQHHVGLAKYHFIYGDIPTANKLLRLANAAGAALNGVPLPKGAFARGSLYSGKDELRWFYALHEIGKKQFRGTSLKTTPQAYNTNPEGPLVSITLDAVASVMARYSVDSKVNISDPPTHIYTELPDLVSASVSAIDVLLELASAVASEESGTTSAAIPTQAPSKPRSNHSNGEPDLVGPKDRCLMLGWDQTDYKLLEKVTKLAREAGISLELAKEKGKGNRLFVPRNQWERVCKLVKCVVTDSSTPRPTPRQTVASLQRQVQKMPTYWCEECQDHFRTEEQPACCPQHPKAKIRLVEP